MTENQPGENRRGEDRPGEKPVWGNRPGEKPAWRKPIWRRPRESGSCVVARCRPPTEPALLAIGVGHRAAWLVNLLTIVDFVTTEDGDATDDAAFARDRATADYYDQRAPEYDEWYEGRGRFAERDRPGWHTEVVQLAEFVASLSPSKTIDIACGSGFLTRHVRGFVVGLDQSRSMVALAQTRLPNRTALVGDALNLPVADRAFDRVLTGHFYGHLPPAERSAFLAEACRVAPELVVIDSALRPGIEPEQWQQRVLNDGSTHRVFKRYLTARQLAEEIGGEVVFNGSWFVAAKAIHGPLP